MRAVVSIALCAAAFVPVAAQQAPSRADVARWEQTAARVTITRDDWGIAHIHGRSDADAVFGAVYAQAEDDYPRIDANYAFYLGRTARVEGEAGIWTDLRARLYADPDSLRALYARSPADLRALMDAFADGLNYFLYLHPDVERGAIERYEPWMALAFTEGSIGGDIEYIDLDGLAAFYGTSPQTGMRGAAPMTPYASLTDDGEPRGSNGFAIAPSKTLNGHALLFINPHTSFYFRSELQMTSDDGLNAYGAVTWGQFFIYQGFNEGAGWMHTSSGVDNVDFFLEEPVRRGQRWFYRYGRDELPMSTRTITIDVRTPTGMEQRTFTAYFTRHGPVVGRQGDDWISVSLMWNPIDALTQSYTRTKARDLDAYLRVMELHTNSSNNTIFADGEGNIAYLHSNYIPRRDTSFEWSGFIPGSDPRTAYQGVLSIDETPNVINPASGWVYNANNWPWSAAGTGTLDPDDFPEYVELGRYESPRGLHALELLPRQDEYTMASLTALAFDSHMPAFDAMLPPLIRAFDALPATSPLRARLDGPIEVLRDWDRRWGVNSIATSIAVFWGDAVLRNVAAAATAAGLPANDFIGAGRADPDALLRALGDATDRLTSDFGTWQTPWGSINRFQRISPEIGPHFDDAAFSIPVPFTSARWGSLASFGARAYPNTHRLYGTSGNSFVAVVEFGDSVRARALTAGGESGHPASPHFNDQAAIYAMGALRDVYFYPGQLVGHTERVYHPGE